MRGENQKKGRKSEEDKENQGKGRNQKKKRKGEKKKGGRAEDLEGGVDREEAVVKRFLLRTLMLSWRSITRKQCR